jgi:hypothetical protein
MSLDEGGIQYIELRQMEVEKIPGWVGVPEETRSRMIATAKNFTTQTTFRDHADSERDFGRCERVGVSVLA